MTGRAAAAGRRPARKTVNLALQGGGAHGAFTWGVLDAFLKDDRLEIEAVSGASAGAMNAAILLTGLAKGGREGASKALSAFWRAVSIDGGLLDGQRALLDVFLGAWRLGSAANSWFPIASAFTAPTSFNPLDINPLRDVVEAHVDFPALRGLQSVRLFVAATNVRTGKVRVFQRHELTAAMLMASAALPTLFRAVEIDGEAYWDGGYMGNPVLFPLYAEGGSEDIVLVQINPMRREDLPTSSADIADRINEITFNASLLHELRAIDFVRRLIDQGRLDDTHYKRIRLHRIEAQAALNGFGAGSKLDADWDFFQQLHEIGVNAGQRFIAEHFDMIGVEGTLDIAAELF